MKDSLRERISNFEKQSIGLERGTVRLESYNPKWKRIFSDEAYFIYDHLRNESLRLYHCGSTSVPDLDSKPIIDILGSVIDLSELDQQQKKFESIGYEYKGEYGVKGRRYCVLYNPEKTVGYVHLHIFQNGDEEIKKHLHFRDLLRSSAEAKDKYQQHKRYLIEEAKIERSKYSDAKSELIRELQAKTKPNAPSHILVLLGAAKGHKNTLELIKELYPQSQTEVVDLNSVGLTPYSYLNRPKDEFYNLIQKSIRADLTILATPVYWYAMSGVMKDFIDRFSNLMSGEHKSLGESLYGKKFHLVSTGYDLKLPLGFEVPFSATAIYFGIDYMGSTYRSVR